MVLLVVFKSWSRTVQWGMAYGSLFGVEYQNDKAWEGGISKSILIDASIKVAMKQHVQTIGQIPTLVRKPSTE